MFKASEYAAAERAFMDEAVDALIMVSGGIVSLVRREQTVRLDTSRLSTEDGSVIEFTPAATGAEFAVNNDDATSTDVAAFLTVIYEIASQFQAGLEQTIFDGLQRVTKATGNQFDARGRDFFEVWYEMQESVELTFEDDGSISKGFAIWCSPDMAEKLAKFEAEMTPEQRERLDALIQRKRDEYFARKRRRKLS